MARSSRNLMDYGNLKVYFAVFYADPYPKAFIPVSWMMPSLAAFMDSVTRAEYPEQGQYYFVGQASFLHIFVPIYLFWGIWLLALAKKKKYSLSTILLYFGSGYMLSLIYFVAIVTRGLMGVGNINVILFGLFIGIFLTFITIKLNTKLLYSGILSAKANSDKLKDEQRKVSSWNTGMAGSIGGWLGVIVTSFVFERFVPDEVIEGLGFLIGVATIVYCILVFFAYDKYYKVYLLRKFGLTDIKAQFGEWGHYG